MDIDLVRVMAAAFCFWVACNLLGRPRWGLGGGGIGGLLSKGTEFQVCKMQRVLETVQ